MMLHSDRDLFREVILRASEAMGVDSGIIEKDYYVTMFLKALVKRQPQIIFKGGTSLSKCYKLIQRFSEDIDLNLEYEQRPTEGQRKHLKKNIVATIDDFGFTLTNPEQVKSRRDYNKYVIDFASVFDFSALKQYLIVETSVFLRAYPSQTMTAASLIYDYLKGENREDLIAQFALEPFELKVQRLERTFLDKLFAVGDYYLDNKVTEHSRHIYDLYTLADKVRVDDSLRKLFALVREERQGHAACLSAQEDVDLKSLLQRIIDEAAYKSDYEAITEKLLFEKVPYEAAVGALQKIVDSELFQQEL